MKYFIDTNIFLRVLTGDNRKQYTESIQILSSVKNNKLDAYTSSLVIAELVWVLEKLYKYPKTFVIERIEGILNLNGLNLVDTCNLKDALQTYSKSTIKYIDAAIASIAEIQEKRMTIVSYDSDFGKLPVLWRRPAELLSDL